jgi:hypothetical protein
VPPRLSLSGEHRTGEIAALPFLVGQEATYLWPCQGALSSPTSDHTMAKKTNTIKLVPIPASIEFIKALGIGIKKAGFTNRSEFIREAIAEKFAAVGVKFPAKLVQPPRVVKQRSKAAKKK